MQCPRQISSWCCQASVQRALRPALLLAAITLSGCVPFESKFALDAGKPADRHQPLAGAWTGTWQDQLGASDRQARAVVELVSPSTCNVWLELSGYRNVVASWIVAPDAPIDRRPDGSEHFHIKVPLESRPKQDVWAVAIDLDADARPGDLSVHFRTNDAMRQLDEGTIRLNRSTH